uniref:UNK5 n=1 Tax=Tetrahymena thermophila TaxID=5911 RepID=UPI001FBC14FC|nr:Chain R, UNK5 [Tetrahymena thermophila]
MNIAWKELENDAFKAKDIAKFSFSNASNLANFVAESQALATNHFNTALNNGFNVFFAVAGLLVVGVLVYIFFNSVGGMIIRSRIKAAQPNPNQVKVLVMPFVALGVSLVISRAGINGDDFGYKG